MILLDTHAFFWMTSEPHRLSRKAVEAIREERAGTGVAIATISLLELARLAENHRIALSQSMERFLSEAVSRVIVKPMTPEIVSLAVRLPSTFPKDPADRVIAATAMADGATLVTADQKIRDSGALRTIW
jgi:PIN domain nuclease of toxin-antitoxin system